MLESRDSAIKLFGKEIPLHHDLPASSPPPDHHQQHDKDTRSAKTTQIKEKDEASQSLEESTEQDTSSMIIDDQNPAPVDIKPPPIDIESTTTDAQKPEEEQSETSVSKEKTSKKPDKILPCPRCNSMDTKFCYYNNYNVNQPRHFCKNCQRYWTAGGTMRNVPVGAGRRKNKNSSHYRHITMSEALQTAQTDMTEALHHNTLKPNGTVLSFGADAPLCESMASVLKIAEKTVKSCQRNGFHHRTEEKATPVSCGGCDNGEEHSSGSSVTATNSAEEGNQANLQEPAPQNCQPLPPHIPCFVGAPWNYPWNSPAQWSTPIAPPPAFCASSFPISFYTAPAYWGCTVPGAWTIPWVSPPSSSPTAGSSGSGPNSLTLGKHSRDGNMLKETDTEKEETLRQNSSERSLWFPKTLRIDDPDEAAKSSIWTTLGIKNGKTDTLSGRGFFKDFKSKADVKNQMAETSPALHANPAALSRSLSFRERS